MKGAVNFINKNIKSKMLEHGFVKAKYGFEKSLPQNYKILFSVGSVNYIDFQDIQVVMRLNNDGKTRVMEYLEELYFNEPDPSILYFKFSQYDKMQDGFWGGFNKDKYEIFTEEDAKVFVSDLIVFLDNTLFSDKLNTLIQVDSIEHLINGADVFTSSAVKDVDFRRFYDGLIFSKLSNKNNLDTIFSKYFNYTNGWDREAKIKIENLFAKLKAISKSNFEKIYYNDNGYEQA